MPGALFKVWSVSEKKLVFASSMGDLISAGRRKLGLRDEKIYLYLQNGTEVDEDDVLQALEPQTVIYLLHKDNVNPWEQVSRVIPVEELKCSFVLSENDVTTVNCPIKPVNSPIETNKVTFDIMPYLQQPWPCSFNIPVNIFSEELQIALESGNLYWHVKSELLGHISREILKYTLKPSVSQRDQVAKQLVSLYPMLKSSIGEGEHGWSQKINDKMSEEAKRRIFSKQPSNNEGVICVNFLLEEKLNFV